MKVGGDSRPAVVFSRGVKPPMKKPYKIVSSASKSTPSSRDLADWLAKDGQLLLPLVALLEKGERAIDAVIDVIDVMGRRPSRRSCG